MIHVIEFFHKYFSDENNDGYRLLNSSVCLTICEGLYTRFLKDGIEPIEELPEERKRKLYNESIKYYSSKEQIVKASKTAYVLQLITSNE